MTGVYVSDPPVHVPITGPDGLVSRPWYVHFRSRHEQAGGSVDKIDAAHAAAVSAAPKSTQVVAAGGLHAGGDLTGNVAVALYRTISMVSALPATGNTIGDWAFARDGRKTGEGVGAGTGCPVFWSNGHWVAVATNGTVAA